jgi:serine/threonine protein kinase
MADGIFTYVAQIGRYRITGELGRGGMGIVYRGEDPTIGREVAIKTMTEVTPELRARFYLEARSGILSHPNIVTVYELGEHQGNCRDALRPRFSCSLSVPIIRQEETNPASLQSLNRTRNTA